MITPLGGDGRRFAIYFAPSTDSPLSRFGSACLGRDASTGSDVPHPMVDGLPMDRWRQMTASPRMYGFHATLKPPFHLAVGRTPEELVGDLEEFAATRRAFEIPPLRLTRISNFLALVPREESPDLSALAEACVRRFEQFRAPLSLEDAERRAAAALTPRQQELLGAWGYPYVLEEWRFHMTLASGLAPGEIHHLLEVLGGMASHSCDGPLPVNAVCLFEQPRTDAPFRLVTRFAFGGTV